MGNDERLATFEQQLRQLTGRVEELEAQLSAREHTAAAAVMGAIAHQAHAGRRLLIVEDDRLMQRMLARSLRPLADVVTIVSTCKEAMQQRHEHDVGIFDLQLPDGCGLELAEQLDVTEIYFFTGVDDRRLLRRAAEVGTVIPKMGAESLGALISRLS